MPKYRKPTVVELDDILAMDELQMGDWLEHLPLHDMEDFARANEIPLLSWPDEWLDDEYPQRQDEMADAIWEWLQLQLKADTP